MKKTLPVIALIALIYATVSVVNSRPKRVSLPPPAEPPKTSFAVSVAGVGLVEASSENISVSTPVSGLVTRVAVKVGDFVKAGAPLFSLDDRDLQAELTVRKAALEVARQKLKRLEESPRPEEIPPAEARVREAESALGDAKVQLQLIESVTDKRAIRDEDLQRRRFAVQAAQARLEQEQTKLALLKSGSWKPDLEVARSEVQQAEAQVKRIQTDINRLTVQALADGRILQCNVRPGEYAQSGQLPKPLMVVGDVGTLHIRTDVDENDAAKVKAGAQAYAYLRGKTDRQIPLEFVRFEPFVIPKKSLTGDSTERVDTRVLQVVYRVVDQSAPIFVGQQMDVFIDGSSKP